MKDNLFLNSLKRLIKFEDLSENEDLILENELIKNIENNKLNVSDINSMLKSLIDNKDHKSLSNLLIFLGKINVNKFNIFNKKLLEQLEIILETIDDVEILDLTIQLLENNSSQNCVKLLEKSRKLKLEWLEEYKQKVIKDIKQILGE